MWDTIKRAILQAVEHTLPKKKATRVNKEWCNEECKKAVEARKKPEKNG